MMISFLERKQIMEIRWNLPGKIYLVGTEPSSAKSLTTRAVEVLCRADVVFHDGLVASEILEIVPSRTAVYSVDERSGSKDASREDISKRVVSAARSGQTVVLLKSAGSPLFGETQEELGVLREAGVDFEVLPGVKTGTEEVIELFRAEESGVDCLPRNNIHV